MTETTDGLLMIEPKLPPGQPVDDPLTTLAELVFACADPGSVGSRWRGTHRCVCGVRSDNGDWHVGGLLTNSLMVHYMRDHRSEVPANEIAKIFDVASRLGITI